MACLPPHVTPERSLYRAGGLAYPPRLCASLRFLVAIISLQLPSHVRHIIVKAPKMSDAWISLLNATNERLSLSKPNVEWLRGIDGIEAKLIITAVQCPGFLDQHYWVFLLQVAVPDGLELTDVRAFEVLCQAEMRAYELRQTQKWFFRLGDIQFVPPSKKRRRDDDLNPFYPKHPRILEPTLAQGPLGSILGPGSLPVTPSPTSLPLTPDPTSLERTPDPSPLGLVAASVEVPRAGQSLNGLGSGVGANEAGSCIGANKVAPGASGNELVAASVEVDDRPMLDVSESDGAASTMSSHHGGSAEQVSPETNDTNVLDLELQQPSVNSDASGSQGVSAEISNLRKRKTPAEITSAVNAEAPAHPLGERRYATPKTRYRVQSSLVAGDPMEWENDMQPMQSSHTEMQQSSETDHVVGAAEGSRTQEHTLPESVSVGADSSNSSRDLGSDVTKANGRVRTLVRAVVQGAHGFQTNRDLESAWMKELKARPERCATAIALNEAFLKQVNAVSMNQWVSHLLYGCSELVLGTNRGRKSYQPSHSTSEMGDSPAVHSDSESSPVSADGGEINEAGREMGAESRSRENKDKRYRCRTLARIVVALINCLITELDDAGADVDQAYNMIPALAGKSSHGVHRSFSDRLSGRLWLLSK